MTDRTPNEIGDALEAKGATSLAGRRVPQSGAGNVIRLPLRNKSREIVSYAVIDGADIHLARYRWSLTSDGYVIRGTRKKGKQKFFYLHREVMRATKREQVDHIDGNPLNNRRSNLRKVTRAEQQQNFCSHRDARSRHRGVSFDTRRGTWNAEVMSGGKRFRRSGFATEDEAAAVARQLRQRHMTHNNEERV